MGDLFAAAAAPSYHRHTGGVTITLLLVGVRWSGMFTVLLFVYVTFPEGVA